MRIFVTGATGVLGRSVVKLLRDAGHQVKGLARSPENRNLLHSLEVEPVQVDLFDQQALNRVLAGSEALLHLATKIPPAAKMKNPVGWAENDRIRREGTHALVEAALAADVATMIYPSVVLPYADNGDAWIDSATRIEAASFLQSTLYAETEVGRFAKAGRRGISLRLGQLLGPESSQSRDALQMAKSGLAAIPGSLDAYQSTIWVADAARAFMAAVEKAPSGIYDVVDNQPLRRAELLEAMAAAVGRKRLIRLPGLLVRMTVGQEVAQVNGRSQRVSNRRFKAATGWEPTVPNAREGWRLLAESLKGATPDKSA